MTRATFTKLVFASDLRPGMTVAETVFSKDGNVLIETGTVLTEQLIHHLSQWNIRFIKIETYAHERQDALNVKGFEYRPVSVEYGKKVAREIHKSTTKVTEEILVNLREKRRDQIDAGKIRDATVKLVDEAIENREIFLAMLNIKRHGSYLYTHCLNVSVLSILTGIALNLRREELLELGEGGLLHDVGMCVLPPDIWDTDKIIDDDQFYQIQKHPMFGNDILQASRITNPKVINIIYQHHERTDGSGYPQGLSGDKIHLYARIVAVCDVFDAMNSNRRYRGSFLPYDIMSHLLRNSYVTLDPDVIKAFVKFVSLFPVGSFVKLNSNETCLVVGANEKSPIRPVVKVVLDAHNHRVESGRVINLIESDQYFIVQPVIPLANLVDAFEDY